MDGEAVTAIIDAAARAAEIKEPKVYEGPGFRKLAVEKIITAEGGISQREVDLTDLPLDDPRPAPLKVHTLTGLVDYIRANRDQVNLDEAVVHVVDHTKVQLISKTTGAFHRRTVFAEATYQELTPAGDPPFRFGQFTKADVFNVALQALFTDARDRAKVLEVIGNAKRTSAVKIEDDGVAQAVFSEGGITLGKDVKVPNPVFLAPWRTFREVEQPASQFILRVGPDEMPTFALFEADGGAWKLEAIEEIKMFLRSRLIEEVDTTSHADGALTKMSSITGLKTIVAIVA